MKGPKMRIQIGSFGSTAIFVLCLSNTAFLQTLRGVCESSAVGLSVWECVDTSFCMGTQFQTNLYHSKMGNFKSATVGVAEIF